MPEKDYVGVAKKIKKKTVFEQKEFIKFLRKWIREKGYLEIERYFDEIPGEEGTETSFKWECEKEVEEYVKAIIEINYKSLTNPVKIKRAGKVVKADAGFVEVEFLGYLLKDTEEKWKLHPVTPWRRVIRDMYDKFVMKDKFKDYENTLLNDIELLIESTKTYLKIKKYD